MCQECCRRSPQPRISRAQFLKLVGLATAGVAVAAGCSSGEPGSAQRGGPVLIDNVRGFTLTPDGPFEFSSLLVGADGRVGGLDVANAGGAERIDGRGRVLIPGLHDAHGHFGQLGANVSQLNLAGTKSLGEAMQALKAFAAEHPERQWILGRGWNDVIWGSGRLPSAADLDAVVPDRPVWLVRVDGHAGVANTAALRQAGITRDTPTPPGGEIVRGADGAPTGAFVDAAQDLVEAHLPKPTTDDLKQNFIAAQRKLNEVGLTSVSDAGTSAAELAVLHQLASSGELTIRTNSFLTYDAYRELGAQARGDSFADDMLRVRTVKLYIDGALGSHGAAMLAPYSDDPENSGLPQMDAAELRNRVTQVMRDGFQVATHAIGDAGNRMVLDAYEAAMAEVGGDMRHRIEHAQVLAVEDIPRLRRNGIIASMQPVHATDDMNMAEERVGAQRIAGAYAWRTMLEQGITIASGSDFPVSSENPFDGLHAAITRTDREGRPVGGWYPQQAMKPDEALRSFTLDAAFAAHQERVLGSLEPGKRADFVILDQDPLDPPSGRARWQTKTLQTWVAGRRVGEYGEL
ncbi:amidohydrolase [Saccharopolyspora indica]|uniref:amidohydrolase n=1 Tax=Saccharopolyspora indica TaxID=1229659 RepID=UPI0022EA460E|nr:amidohydrolase [Saccharopolyspora indica]MDA3645362.1 amidohydrolase [Saccharopolyspora indica]